MKASEAEKLICPFIESCIDIEDYRDDKARNIRCITSKCMAWKCTNVGSSPEKGYCQRLNK